MNDSIIIEEIKSTYARFSDITDDNVMHWAQAEVYAFIYSKTNNISKKGRKKNEEEVINKQILNLDEDIQIIEQQVIKLYKSISIGPYIILFILIFFILSLFEQFGYNNAKSKTSFSSI